MATGTITTIVVVAITTMVKEGTISTRITTTTEVVMEVTIIIIEMTTGMEIKETGIMEM